MINEARTLLLNVSGSEVDLTADFSEYVPIEYVKLATPTWLTTVRQILFGSDNSVVQQNIVLQKYMQLLHASTFADHLVAMDPRFTYLPFKQDEFVTGGSPTIDVGEIVVRLQSVVYPNHPIFKHREPYTTCRNLWNQHQLAAYKLTGVLLAVIYNMRDIRNGVA